MIIVNRFYLNPFKKELFKKFFFLYHIVKQIIFFIYRKINIDDNLYKYNYIMIIFLLNLNGYKIKIFIKMLI